MFAAVVGMAVEVEKHGLRCAAPEFLQRGPVESGIEVEVFVHSLEQAAPVLRRAAGQLGILDWHVAHGGPNQNSGWREGGS